MPDLQNQVFVASDPSWLNCDLAELEKVLSPLCIKVPLSLNRDASELHVYQDVVGEQLPAPLVHKIVRLIVDHVLMAGQLPGYKVLKDRFIYSILNGLLTDRGRHITVMSMKQRVDTGFSSIPGRPASLFAPGGTRPGRRSSR